MKPHRAMALFRWVVIVAILAAVGFGGSQLFYRMARPEVMITRPVDAPVVQAFYATGTLLPRYEYPIKANNPGFVTKVLVDKGDRLKKDQPVAIVSEDAVQFKFDQATAELQQKKKLIDEKNSPVLLEYDSRLAAYTELLEIGRREQRRLTNLLESGKGSQADLDRSLDRVKLFWVEVEQIKAQKAAKRFELQKDFEIAEAALKISQWSLDRQTILCPIDQASVLDWPVTVGTRVAVNDALMRVADVRPEKLLMRAQVDEEDKTHVHLGQPVRMVLYSYGGRPFVGKVDRIYDKADPERRTFEIDVEMVEKDPGFSAGMTAELAFIMAQKEKARVIPTQAVQNGEVWLVREGRLQKAEVKLGLKSVERTEVVTGLKDTDEVVISALDKPQAGQRVRTRFMDPFEAAQLNKPKTNTDGFSGFR